MEGFDNTYIKICIYVGCLVGSYHKCSSMAWWIFDRTCAVPVPAGRGRCAESRRASSASSATAAVLLLDDVHSVEHNVQKRPGSPRSPQSPPRSPACHRRTRTGSMELKAAPLLCWLCCCWVALLDAAVVPPAERRGGGPAVVVPHEYMVALYHRLAHSKESPRGGGGEEPRAADTATGFVDQAPQHTEVSALKERRFVFDISSLPEADEVVGAELRVLRKAPENQSLAWSQEGLFHRLILSTCDNDDQDGGNGSEDDDRKLLDSRAGDTVEAGDTILPHWEVFDAWAALRHSHRPRELCFLLSLVSESSGRPLPPGQMGFGLEQLPLPHERALLVVFSRAKRKESLFKEIHEKAKGGLGPEGLSPEPAKQKAAAAGRRRRRTTLAGRASASSSSSSSSSGLRSPGKKAKSRCSRKALHVNFKELGWDDWIIAPLDYEAYHCDGACDFPLRSHLEPTNHAIIQTLMNSMDPEAAPPSCCVPSKLSPISILYIDAGNNVVYKQYEDMVVESCGCR
nr:PREDICTED: growth/differentiation factor 7 [Anolis carolinensis]|eukprot:XP_003215511.2 PREDICTED: growth/differentiation factor 7 [Anolis carolinensis]